MPLLVDRGDNTDARAAGLVRRGHRVVLVAGGRLGTTGQTNLIQVEVAA